MQITVSNVEAVCIFKADVAKIVAPTVTDVVKISCLPIDIIWLIFIRIWCKSRVLQSYLPFPQLYFTEDCLDDPTTIFKVVNVYIFEIRHNFVNYIWFSTQLMPFKLLLLHSWTFIILVLAEINKASCFWLAGCLLAVWLAGFMQ